MTWPYYTTMTSVVPFAQQDQIMCFLWDSCVKTPYFKPYNAILMKLSQSQDFPIL